MPLVILAIYCALLVAASLLGGVFPSLVRLTHTRMQMAMSLVAGLMLGVALLHMLPHAAQAVPLAWVMQAALVGLLMMFFMMRILHFHQHPADDEPEPTSTPLVSILPIGTSSDFPSASSACDDASHSHAAHSHSHGAHSHGSHSHGAESQAFSWIGLALGLALHTLIDGMALAASVATEAAQAKSWGLFGFGTFLAIALHKPLDALSITTVMAAQGWSSSRQRLVNAAFAVVCPVGALLFLLGTRHYVEMQTEVLGLALAFSAGVFLCISLGDLLPEVHFHSHDRGKLSAMLLIGVALAFLVGFLEPKHADTAPPGLWGGARMTPPAAPK